MTVAVISDCRGTAKIDQEDVAAALEVDETVVVSSIADHKREIADRIEAAGTNTVLFVADEPSVATLRKRLVAADYRTERVSPFLGAASKPAVATTIVAGAANAALNRLERLGPPEEDSPGQERLLVVGDPLLARDLVALGSVTLVADGRDLADVSLPESVEVRRGQVTDLERQNGGYAVTVESRVTEECTECGRCLRRFPEGTTDVPIQVTGEDVTPAVCPEGAIRPPGEPQVIRFEASQVVWPGYDGPLRSDRWVHSIRTGVAGAAYRAAVMRARTAVTVDHSTCAVGTAGNEGCTACEDACPNDAISISLSRDGGVSIEGDRCVACGTCVSVCPTDSLEPSRVFDVAGYADLVDAALGPITEDGGSRLPWGDSAEQYGLAFVSDAVWAGFHAAVTARPVPAVIPIRTPNVLSVPDAALLYALARGADGILLASDPDRASEPVEDAARSANRALADLGLAERVTVADTADPDQLARALEGLTEDPLDAVPTGAVERSSRHDLGLTASVALAAGHGSAVEAVTAPGSGSVMIDAEGCTLCSTCHETCPTDALVQEPGTLTFYPESCVGCGHCETACPEDVIEVTQSVPLVDGAVVGPDTVVEKEMVECSVCGRPFASRDGIEAMKERLDEADLEALDFEVCPDCRTSTSAALTFDDSK
ncbi:MAG: 4Fe-4S binding protein [Halodesulfurarchaeum sp.]